MPNHVNCIGLFLIDWDAMELASSSDDNSDAELERRLERLKTGNLCDKACPGVDESNEAALERWGTKWGAYEVKAIRLGGDCFPVIVEFNSAWCPPNAETMKAINDYLRRECFLINHRWIGCNPYDSSVFDIPVCSEVKSE